MSSRMSLAYLMQVARVSVAVACVSALATYLLPDTRTDWYKNYQAKEFEIAAEKAIAAHREQKCKGKE